MQQHASYITAMIEKQDTFCLAQGLLESGEPRLECRSETGAVSSKVIELLFSRIGTSSKSDEEEDKK